MVESTDTVVARTREEAVGLIAELDRRRQSARDIVIEGGRLGHAVHTQEGKPSYRLEVPFYGDAVEAFPLRPTALAQLAEASSIPGDYARRIHEGYPGLFAQSVETLLPKDKGRFVRVLDGAARAVLSDRFRVLDHFDLAFTALSEVNKVNGEVSRWTLTDDKFEARFIVPDWREAIEYRRQEVREQYGASSHVRPQGGSVIIPGVYVSNSETGRGGLNVKPFLYDLICSNGLIGEVTLRQVHLGSQMGEGLLSREAIEADSKAIWFKVRDLIAAVFDREQFRASVEKFRATGEFQLGKPVEAVDLLVKSNGLTDDDRQAILNELVAPSHGREAGGTVLALLNAVTQRAQAYEASDPEKCTELETLGGRILANPQQYVVVRK